MLMRFMSYCLGFIMKIKLYIVVGQSNKGEAVMFKWTKNRLSLMGILVFGHKWYSLVNSDNVVNKKRISKLWKFRGVW